MIKNIYKNVPQIIRKNVLMRDNYHCKWCGSTTNLELHHKIYDINNLHKPINLIVLCFGCHKKVHKLFSKFENGNCKTSRLFAKSICTMYQQSGSLPEEYIEALRMALIRANDRRPSITLEFYEKLTKTCPEVLRYFK